MYFTARLNGLRIETSLNKFRIDYLISKRRTHHFTETKCLLKNSRLAASNQLITNRSLSVTPPIYCAQSIIDNNNVGSVKSRLQRAVTSDLSDELDADPSAATHRIPHPFDTRIDNEFLDEIGGTIPTKSYNVAAFVNKSHALQQLVKLGVNLYEIENKTSNMIEFIIRLNFDNDIKPYIQFLHDNGVPAEELGNYFTKNPAIFMQDMDVLQQRIDYLRSKKCNKSMIAMIITRAPKWLSTSIERVDAHLGFLQKEYKLSGDQMRHILVTYPKIALLRDMHLRETTFMFREEMGFSLQELQKIVVENPDLWSRASYKSAHQSFVKVFDFVHNEMKIPHKIITEFSPILNQRQANIKARHLYLKMLKRDQYNPEQPLYIPLYAFYQHVFEDAEFCEKYARTSVADYNQFLKSL